MNKIIWKILVTNSIPSNWYENTSKGEIQLSCENAWLDKPLRIHRFWRRLWTVRLWNLESESRLFISLVVRVTLARIWVIQELWVALKAGRILLALVVSYKIEHILWSIVDIFGTDMGLFLMHKNSLINVFWEPIIMKQKRTFKYHKLFNQK